MKTFKDFLEQVYPAKSGSSVSGVDVGIDLRTPEQKLKSVKITGRMIKGNPNWEKVFKVP
jgi:hypothetical protein